MGENSSDTILLKWKMFSCFYYARMLFSYESGMAHIPPKPESLLKQAVPILKSNATSSEHFYDEEVQACEAHDEYAEHFKSIRPPNTIITTSNRPSKKTLHFVKALMEVLPCSIFCERRNYDLSTILGFAKDREFSDIVILNEDNGDVKHLFLIHLPRGPMASFLISNIKTSSNINEYRRSSKNKPELILNNFTSRLGRRVGRMFGSLFHQKPYFMGREVIVFSNTLDCIFFRHYRYLFDLKKHKNTAHNTLRNSSTKVKLQMIGPSFTLKLKSYKDVMLDYM